MGIRKQLQCVSVGAALACLSAVLWSLFYRSDGSVMFIRLFSGCSALVCSLLAVAAVDISFRHPADSHTLKSLLSQYVIYSVLRLDGMIAYRNFMKLCQNVASSQEKALLSLAILPNVDTEFGRKYDFKNIKSREDYRRKVPLSTYSDYIPYVKRIEANPDDAKGGLLTKYPVAFLAVTSGSTGNNKTIPVAGNVKRKSLFMKSLPLYLTCKQTGGLRLQRQLRLGYKPVVERTPSGLVKAPISFHMNKNLPFSLVPHEVYQIQNEQTALYTEAVFALAEREVGSTIGLMATLVWAFWRIIEQNWEQMCDDIERGSIHHSVKMEPYIRRAVNEHITADPKRATQLREIFRDGPQRLFKRLWPGYQYTVMFVTGGFSHYSRVLLGSVLDGTFVMSPFHGATEGVFGMNLSPSFDNSLKTSYTSCMMTFQEYIPISNSLEENDKDQKQPQTVFAEQLQIGECYEVVSTCPIGTYRYRMGDVIKVVGFQGQCPIYEFQYRMGHVLNVSWEKTTENVVYESLVAACTKLELKLTDYTTTEDINVVTFPEYVPNSDCKHYVLFLEFTRVKGSPSRLTSEEKFLIDEELCERMELYNTLRQKGNIGPMHVVEVTPGTFETLRAHMLSFLNNQQVKMPRVLRNGDFLKRLLGQQAAPARDTG